MSGFIRSDHTNAVLAPGHDLTLTSGESVWEWECACGAGGTGPLSWGCFDSWGTHVEGAEAAADRVTRIGLEAGLDD